jgi:hypothetical protein
LDIVDLEERLDQQLQRPRVTDLAAARMAATTWSRAIWSLAISSGPLILSADEIERAFAVASRPVFILGVHRSGTTLVRDLLDAHPELSVLPAEGTMFTNFEWHLKHLRPDDWLRFLGCEWLRRLANPINQQPYWLLGHSPGEGSPYVDFARALMAWWPLVRTRLGPHMTSWPLVAVVLAYTHCTAGFRTKGPLRKWVEKTPTNERFLSRLTAEFPEARLLHVIRDPAAVYASHRRAAQNAGCRLDSGSRILLQMRLSYQEAASRSVPPISDSYMLLCYEDLLGDPVDSVHRIAAFLGIRPLPVLARPTANGHPTPSNSSFGWNEVPGRLNRRPPGDAFGVLTRHDRERVSAMVGDAAGQFGYRHVPLSALHRIRLRMLVRVEWLVDRLRVRWKRISPLRKR